MRKHHLISLPAAVIALAACAALAETVDHRPNILFCISDDQSYPHAGANVDPVVKTPTFDRIAREGIRFTHAFCNAPSCGPSRMAICTGQDIWRLEEGGNIHSFLPTKFKSYQDLLQDAGYFVGHTGKGCTPCNDRVAGRKQHAAGPGFTSHGKASYARNFADFLSKRPEGKPFSFWFGTFDAHRSYRRGSGLESGMDPSEVIVPRYLPDHQVVREDMLDYYFELQRYDREVGNALRLLEEQGELDNTIVVMTSDNGMPFPRAKATIYDSGTHMPLAIRWPGGIKKPGRVYEGCVNLSTMAPTFLEAAGIEPREEITAVSLMDIFESPDAPVRQAAYTAMERHDGCRKGGKGYPMRAIRTPKYLYIRNYEPDRWPAGDPDRENCARYIPFGEVDPAPSKTLLLENEKEFRMYYDLAFGKRPAEELFDVEKDPGQINNLADKKEYAEIREQLRKKLDRYLLETRDPRALGHDPPWDSYRYFGRQRNPDWKINEKP